MRAASPVRILITWPSCRAAMRRSPVVRRSPPDCPPVVVRRSPARRRYERQGILVDEEAGDVEMTVDTGIRDPFARGRAWEPVRWRRDDPRG